MPAIHSATTATLLPPIQSTTTTPLTTTSTNADRNAVEAEITAEIEQEAEPTHEPINYIQVDDQSNEDVEDVGTSSCD